MVTTLPRSSDVALRPLDLDVEADVAAYTDLENAVIRADSPWEPERTPRMTAGYHRYGWDLEPPVTHLARTPDGVVVGSSTYETSAYDNHHLAWVGIRVHPAHRRLGVGSTLLESLIARARSEGRTSIGTHGWEGPAATGFAARHGLELRSVGVARRQDLDLLDPADLTRRYDEARPHAAAYRVEEYPYPTPEAELADVAVMVAAINDAPTDDLDIEDEAFPPERVRGFETAHELRGVRVHRVVARHRVTGRFAGQTIVAVDPDQPAYAVQYDTSVVAEHRGHRLGLLLKLEMIRLLATREPQVRTVDTWNAESNSPMIAVNEALGYRVLGRTPEFQRSWQA